MLILVLSLIASSEGKVYLKLSSNVKNEEKVNKETVTLGLISILVEVSKKQIGTGSLCSKSMKTSTAGELGRPMRF